MIWRESFGEENTEIFLLIIGGNDMNDAIYSEACKLRLLIDGIKIQKKESLTSVDMEKQGFLCGNVSKSYWCWSAKMAH